MASKRPRRGPAGNILVTGDVGTYGGPQGGAKPGATESGDLQSREFGVPQADIPGGLRHVVNPEAKVAKTTDKPRRPADYHKYHGVPSDNGQYAITPGAEHDKPARSAAEPKLSDAVPVYITQSPGKTRKIRKFIIGGRRSLAANAADGTFRLADRDDDRVQVYIQNENATAANNILIGDEESMRQAAFLAQTSAGETIFGYSIPGSKAQYTFETQDELWVVNPSAAAVIVSWAFDTEVPFTDPSVNR